MKTVKTLKKRGLLIPKILEKASFSLSGAGVTFPADEAGLLLALALQRSTEFLYAHPEYALTAAEYRRFMAYIRRRCRREPVAYLANQKAFYGSVFHVNRQVLIPRPETEQLVDLALKEIRTQKQPKDIVDVGTGSGAIILSLAKMIDKTSRFFATDSSKRALRVARDNAKRLRLDKNVTFLHGNLFQPYISQTVSAPPAPRLLLIVANLPYLTSTEMKKLQPEVQYEPRKALDGGQDGLDAYRSMFRQIIRARIPFTAICEIAPQQKKPLLRFLQAIFPSADVEFFKDATSRTRFVRITEESS